MPAVKADGYGHGAVEVSRAAISAGADMLGVASVDEAAELRESGIDSPILVLGCSLADSAHDIVDLGITATVCDLSFAARLADKAAAAGKRTSVHVKVDTGMGRIGVPVEGAIDLVTGLMGLPSLEIDGIFTHFPSADEQDGDFTESQISIFKGLLKVLDKRGITPPIAHSANSGAILDHRRSYFDMVRPGIMFYGLYPSPDSSRSVPLTPALTLKTKIVFLKELPSGKTVSYGRTFTTARTTRVATIAVGYADGYSRAMSNRAQVAIRGVLCPVIGRVCMDQVMVDVTDLPEVELGDDVVLYGGGHDALAIEAVAEMTETIPHDVCCAIGKRVPRVYKRGR